MEPKWRIYSHEDGTEQVWDANRGMTAPAHAIERVVRDNSRRKNWAIVYRRGDEMYPKKVAGPFKDLDAAKVAYLMLMAALT